VVVLNKIDTATPEQVATARQIIRSLNPDADLIETSQSRVPLDRVLNTGRFDYAKAQQHPLWFKELYGFADHKPETEEYGIRSFVYRERRPFHPEKFHRFINSAWPGVIRAKGHFWLATRPEWVGELSQAGALVRTEAIGFWWADVPKSHWPDDAAWRATIQKRWDKVYGDRQQELVFIGTDMDEAAIRRQLDACLIGTGREMAFDPKKFRLLPDPFPEWRRAAAA
jgi:G3E family GTPase